jgi:hypothetical protein
MVLDEPMNADAFRAYVRLVLAPTLRPGDIVVMDNLPAHKVTDIRTMIEAAGARLLYLPPYSPDFNPIENAFSKLRTLCAKPPPAASPTYGTRSAPPSISSHRPGAQTTSPPQDTSRNERILLYVAPPPRTFEGFGCGDPQPTILAAR